MSKKVFLVIVLLLVTIAMAGCPGRGPVEPPEPQEITEIVTLYYGDAGNETLVSEEREITYLEGEDRYVAALKALISGPETEGYTANIRPETTVYGTIRQNDALIVNVSDDFQQFGGSVAEIVAVLSIVNTLTDFDGIERVKILVEGNELIGPSGEPRGFMERYVEGNVPAVTVETITLYFANPDATALLAEERDISVTAGGELTDRLRIATEELIRGPKEQGRVRTIPTEVRVLSVRRDDEVAFVDFSEEMHTRHSGGAAGETMTILSIVNTLTEFEGIELVAMTVEGAPMNIEHVILDAPVQRNEAIIQNNS